MKKNLAMSIAMLVLAVLTCCGVTFAYFSASQDGGGNTIGVGRFVFDSVTEINNSAEFHFKAPTIINLPEVTDGTPTDADYETKHNDYLVNGDDKYFDSYVVPVTITATNNSVTDMGIAVRITAAAFSDSGSIPNYAANGGFQYFVFDKTTTAALNVSTDTNKYEKAIREASAEKVETDIAPTDIFTETKNQLNLSRNLCVKNMTTLEVNKLGAVNINESVISSNSVELLAVMWLDWRGFKEGLGNSRPEGKLKISVEVTATQFGQSPEWTV